MRYKSRLSKLEHLYKFISSYFNKYTVRQPYLYLIRYSYVYQTNIIQRLSLQSINYKNSIDDILNKDEHSNDTWEVPDLGGTVVASLWQSRSTLF